MKTPKTTVIYHRADADGWFCREIARKFLPDAELIGWDYGDPLVPMPAEGTLYILDLSPDSIDQSMDNGTPDWSRMIWIDHHKTAIEKYQNWTIPGYRIDGVAACRLAWQWFTRGEHTAKDQYGGLVRQPDFLATKQDFVGRMVFEPDAVRLAGEYDIWDKRDPNAELFQHGLRSEDLHSVTWDDMLDVDGGAAVIRLLNQGRALQYARTKENEGIINAFGFTLNFEGFCLLACNAARYNSQLFAAGLKPHHDGCFGFNWDGPKHEWRVSLYSDKPGIDLSGVAKKYGGGGHAGDCGFRCKTLPFELL